MESNILGVSQLTSARILRWVSHSPKWVQNITTVILGSQYFLHSFLRRDTHFLNLASIQTTCMLHFISEWFFTCGYVRSDFQKTNPVFRCNFSTQKCTVPDITPAPLKINLAHKSEYLLFSLHLSIRHFCLCWQFIFTGTKSMDTNSEGTDFAHTERRWGLLKIWFYKDLEVKNFLGCNLASQISD